MAARDEWIGWSDTARGRHLNKVVCNSRFLILPQVRVKNLASPVLSRVVKRLAADWRQRYGYEPLLVESFVDRSRYEGICYRAANWQRVGQTRVAVVKTERIVAGFPRKMFMCMLWARMPVNGCARQTGGCRRQSPAGQRTGRKKSWVRCSWAIGG